MRGTERHEAVRRMFARIAERYDLANRLMTFGMDGPWRRLAAELARLPDGGVALDVGTGTGDLAFALARSAKGAKVIGLDYTPAMLAMAPDKARDRNLQAATAFLRADGHRIPFGDNTFEAVSSAWVLRNLSDLPRATAEMARILKPGGRLIALEMSPVDHPLWRPVFELYMGRVVPSIGRMVTGDASAYRYLPATARAFLAPDAIAALLGDAGLTLLPGRRLLFGAMVIHVAVKPVPPPPDALL